MIAKDRHPAILVKDAILARSGIYTYSREELLGMGVPLKDSKAVYRVYRPPNVIVEAKDKFSFAVVTKEHTVSDTSPDNFRDQADGVVGDSVEVVTLDDGTVALKGRIAFYTKDVADYFEGGNKETSAQYDMCLVPCSDPVRDGYDFVMTRITSVNGLAITAHGRGGRHVRVLDSLYAINTYVGGNRMKSGFLAFLGIGKAKDSEITFSDVLYRGIEKVKALGAADTAGIDAAVGEVMSYVVPLGDGEAKEVLVGAVSDCLKNIDAVLAQKDAVAKKLNELYAKCRAADAETVKRILDADGKKDGTDGDGGAKPEEDGKKDDKEKKDGKKDSAPAKDAETVIAAAIDKAFDKFGETIDAKIDAALKKALGEGVGSTPASDSRPVFAVDGYEDKDASYLVRGMFGNR
jgi:hypothetical protein